jgi:hypothetical protein
MFQTNFQPNLALRAQMKLTAIKHKAKWDFRTEAMLFYTLQNITLTKE